MTLQLGLATFSGGFIFAFLIRLLWGELVTNFGPAGGWLAAGFIVGTTWSLNHGVGLIYQTGAAWIDMAYAAGFGLFAANIIVDKADVGKGFVNIVFAIVGGILGGFLLSCMG
ncbi:MAG: hypothetical protein CVV00_15730 [Firmicutes bacterium HGW-Firmicutes-5]|nr:MAG: hypothetical protein CVV00_15730 [Firmicutes bacterium HGW-Firmicutes-5]